MEDQFLNITKNDLKTASKFLRSASDLTRLRIIYLCAQCDLTVADLTQITGQSQPRISQHLKNITSAGIFERSQEGPWVFYRLANTPDAHMFMNFLSRWVSSEDTILSHDLQQLKIITRARQEKAASLRINIVKERDFIKKLNDKDQQIEDHILQMVASEPPNKMVEIDIKSGRMLALCSDKITYGVGIGTSYQALQITRNDLDQQKIRNCRVHLGNIFLLPEEAYNADFTILRHVLQYAKDPGRIINQAAQILNPKGRLLITEFAPHTHETLKNKFHHQRLGYSFNELQSLCRAHNIQELETIHIPGRGLNIQIWLGYKTQ